MSYIRANKESIIRWLKMIQVKDCSRSTCPCADKLRKIIITKPYDLNQEIRFKYLIDVQQKRYDQCKKYLV